MSEKYSLGSDDMPSQTDGWFISCYQKIVLERPVFVAILLAMVIGFFAVHAPNYKIDASSDSLVLEGDEDLKYFRELIKRYGSEDFLVVAYSTNKSVFSEDTLTHIAKLRDDLARINGVSSVLSVLDVPLLYSPQVQLRDLSGSINMLRNGDVDLSLAEQEFRDSPIYSQLLTSRDSKTTVLQVNIASDLEYRRLLDNRDKLREKRRLGDWSAGDAESLKQAEEAFKQYSIIAAQNQETLVADVRKVIETYRAGDIRLFLGGVSMIAVDMIGYVKKDLVVFGIGIVLFIVLLLSIIFRSIRWVMLPLLSCVLTNVLMLGLLAWLDWRMTVISSNFIALLLIITLAIAVHLVVRYRELERLHPNASRFALTRESVRLMIRPCVYTSLTTIVAFASLVISGIRPVIDFGWMMTIGVAVALIMTFFVVPLGMLLGGAGRQPAAGAGSDEKEKTSFTRHFARFTEQFSSAILVVAFALAVFAGTGVARLEVENRFIDYFDESTEIYQGMEMVDRELGGTIPLEIIMVHDDASHEVAGSTSTAEDDPFADDFGSDDQFAEEDEFADDDLFADESADGSVQKPSYWFTVSGLRQVERLHDHLSSIDESGKVMSLAIVYKVAKDLLGGNVDDIQLTLAYNSLPDRVSEVMVNPYLSAEHNETRVTVRVKETSRSLRRADLLDSLHEFMQKDMGLSSDQYRFSGMLVLYNNMLQSLFSSQILTLGAVFIAITVMLAILFKSLYLALIGITPNLLAALVVLGGMGWAGIPLDMMTITIAAISIGIGVDNTIHYIHRFAREFPKDKDYIATMYRCHGSIGRAMYYTSITIIFGFSILALSNFKPSIYFGLLTSTAMISALLGSLILLPRLLLLLRPFK